MKVKNLKEILNRHDDDDGVYIELDIMTAYQVEKGMIAPVQDSQDLYHIVKTKRNKETKSIVLFLE